MLETFIAKALWEKVQNWSSPCKLAMAFDYGAEATINVISVTSNDPFALISETSNKLNNRYKGLGVFKKQYDIDEKFAEFPEEEREGIDIFHGYGCYNLATPVVVFYYLTPTGVRLCVNGHKIVADEVTNTLFDFFQKKPTKVSETPTDTNEL